MIVADELSSLAFAHFIGPRRMNSIILVTQEGSSLSVKTAKLSLYPLRIWFPANTAQRRKCMLIIFSISPLHWTSLQSKHASLVKAPFHCLTTHHPSPSALLLFASKLNVQTFIFTEVNRENIFKYGIDMSWPRWKPLKSVLLNPVTIH